MATRLCSYDGGACERETDHESGLCSKHRKLDQPKHVDRLQNIRSFAGHDDNLRMWGKLHVSQTGRTVGGWLVDSWSEHGAPYWQPKVHWFDKGENKFYHVYMDFDRHSMNLHGEDTDIEPDRAKFIRKMLEKWELEWLQEQAKTGGTGRS